MPRAARRHAPRAAEQSLGLATVVFHTAAGRTDPALGGARPGAARPHRRARPHDDDLSGARCTPPDRHHSPIALRASRCRCAIIGVSLLGGRLDDPGPAADGDLRRDRARGRRWPAGSRAGAPRAPRRGRRHHHRTGLLRVARDARAAGAASRRSTRCTGRCSGCSACRPWTCRRARRARAGEISLPALTRATPCAAAAGDPRAAARRSAAAPPAGPRARLAGRDLLLAALTAGQLGIILPVLAGVGQIAQQFVNSRSDEQEALRLLPDSVAGWILAAAALLLRRLGALHARRARRLRGLHRPARRRAAAHPPRVVQRTRGHGGRRTGSAPSASSRACSARRSASPRCMWRSRATPTRSAAARTLFPLVRLRGRRGLAGRAAAGAGRRPARPGSPARAGPPPLSAAAHAGRAGGGRRGLDRRRRRLLRCSRRRRGSRYGWATLARRGLAAARRPAGGQPAPASP